MLGEKRALEIERNRLQEDLNAANLQVAKLHQQLQDLPPPAYLVNTQQLDAQKRLVEQLDERYKQLKDDFNKYSGDNVVEVLRRIEDYLQNVDKSVANSSPTPLPNYPPIDIEEIQAKHRNPFSNLSIDISQTHINDLKVSIQASRLQFENELRRYRELLSKAQRFTNLFMEKTNEKKRRRSDADGSTGKDLWPTISDPKLLRVIKEYPYWEQAVFFLNAYGTDFSADKTGEIWSIQNQFVFYDQQNRDEGKWLAKQDLIRCVLSLDQLSRTPDHLSIFELKRSSLIQYLLYKFQKPVGDLVNRPQPPLENPALGDLVRLVKQLKTLKRPENAQEIDNLRSRITKRLNEIQKWKDVPRGYISWTEEVLKTVT